MISSTTGSGMVSLITRWRCWRDAFLGAFSWCARTTSARRRRVLSRFSFEPLECRVLLSSAAVDSNGPIGHEVVEERTAAAVGDSTRMFRAYNPTADYHFFTTNIEEYKAAVAAGYRDETSGRTGFNVLVNADPGAAPLHRLYNAASGRHYYTTSDGEKNFLVSLGWTFEKEEGFIFPSAAAGTTELFHLYNNNSGTHLFTENGAARSAILAAFPGIWVQHASLGFALPAVAYSTAGFDMPGQISQAEVETLLDRASAASSSNDAILAVVDRGGRILGVRVESGVPISANDLEKRVFAIDGAVAKARTAAFFANNDAPLTSRTIRYISQSTVTQREVDSSPDISDPNSPYFGTGFVAPIGLGGHFPPEIMHTPQVDLFGIEHTNRDSLDQPGLDGIKGTADDVLLGSRFNAQFIAGQEINAPESYGVVSGSLPTAQSRGIATLPGGIPLFKNGNVVGGIGVFFPGPDGYASYEQGFVGGIGQTESQRTNASRVLEAEYIAFAAAGGSSTAAMQAGDPRFSIGALGGVPALTGFDLPFGRIDLVGITLEIYGPIAGIDGLRQLVDFGSQLGTGVLNNAGNQPVTTTGDLHASGQPVPEGWLVAPKGSAVDPNLTAGNVQQIIDQGINEANLVRAAIRLPLGRRTKMVFAVADTSGEVLGLYRMPDATFFSIDVAVAKARNTAYYADATALQPADQLPGIGAGVAFTNRTFRFLAEPRYPQGVDGTPPGPFSILNDLGINPQTAENSGPPQPASAFTSVLGYDAFHPGTNFRDPNNRDHQNGIIFFPGSTPLYLGTTLIGGFGVSGDGVDQDDVVTFQGAIQYLPVASGLTRADQVTFADVRLPYIKFLRNPHA